MVQTMGECLIFLNEARDALDELSLLEEQERQLVQEEERLEWNLGAERKLVTDTIQQTVRQRREEISATYEKEMARVQDQLKKVRSKRERAKNEGVKERIQEETAVFREQIRDLKLQLRTMIRKERVPGYCRNAFYYSVYFPNHVKEYLLLFLYVLVLFLALPCGVYFLIPERKLWYLVGIYLVDIILVGGGYIVVGNRTKLLYLETLREGRKIQDQILSNKKKIKKITSGIRKDRNESLYNLERFDDEIARLQQELSDVEGKQKDAINAFETVTKNILSDEIEHNHKAKLEQLEAEYRTAEEELRIVMQQVKDRRLSVTERYGTYLGKEFMDSQRIVELTSIVQEGRASNVSEAIAAYQSQRQRR